MNFICTSLNCKGPAGKLPHCPRCSHILIYDKVTVEGKDYEFEFSPLFGPSFKRKGEYDWMPNHRHPVWFAFEVWETKLEHILKTRIRLHSAKAVKAIVERR